jgi:bidirectional [NiFe] hydrogenase diaphorase subunit
MSTATLDKSLKPVLASAQLVAADKRYKILQTTMKRHQLQPDALIEVLHKAQELFGYLDTPQLRFVSQGLRLPPSRVFGVATFYHFFQLKPKGRHTCVVCMGTACYVKGADRVLAGIEEQVGVKAGETTPDNQVSVLTARCIGACGIAPVVVYDGTVTPRQGVDDARGQIKEWMSHGS